MACEIVNFCLLLAVSLSLPLSLPLPLPLQLLLLVLLLSLVICIIKYILQLSTSHPPRSLKVILAADRGRQLLLVQVAFRQGRSKFKLDKLIPWLYNCLPWLLSCC